MYSDPTETSDIELYTISGRLYLRFWMIFKCASTLKILRRILSVGDLGSAVMLLMGPRKGPGGSPEWSKDLIP